MKLVVAIIAVVIGAPAAHAQDAEAERLTKFISEGCTYLADHFGGEARAAVSHFGRLRRVERITEHVSTPHARYHFEPNGLRGWRAWIEDGIELVLSVPATKTIRLADLERTFGDAEERDSDMRETAAAQVPAAPNEFQFTRVDKRQTCRVVVIGDGKSIDLHRQRVLEIILID